RRLPEGQPEQEDEGHDHDHDEEGDEVEAGDALARPAGPHEVLRRWFLEDDAQERHRTNSSSFAAGSTSSRPSGPATTLISKTSSRIVAGTTARPNASGEKNANWLSPAMIATMIPSRTMNPPITTAA